MRNRKVEERDKDGARNRWCRVSSPDGIFPQPVTRDNPAANESNPRRAFFFFLFQGELVRKPRNSPRSVRVSMIFMLPPSEGASRPSPSSSSSSSSFYSPFARVRRILDRRGYRTYPRRRRTTRTKIGERWMDSRIRICVTTEKMDDPDPILGKNSINIAPPDHSRDK